MMLFLVAVALLALGVILMIGGILLLLLSRRGGGGEARAAGVIIIGPIPILVASDKETAKLAVLLTVASLVFFALFILVTWGAGP